MAVKVTVNARKALAKLRRLEAKISEKGTITLNEIGQLGKAKAASLVPRDSGVLARNLHFRTTKGQSVSIFVTDPFGNAIEGVPPVRYPGRGVRNFQLVRWMHSSAKAQAVIRSGDPHFMFTTRDYLTREAPTRVRAAMSKVVADINKT
jgi:hypothetical protein